MPTGIEYCDETWNPITGCTAISEGCENCWAKAMAYGRLRGRFGYDQDDPFKITRHPNKLDIPRHWKKPLTIFVGSMTDMFQDGIEEWQLDWALEVVEDCPQHTFLFLTKRAQNIDQKLWGFDPKQTAACGPMRQFSFYGELPPNIQIGVTIENQKRADERAPLLIKVPGLKVRWASLEPMLGPIDMSPYLGPDKINWVVLGGETGPNARPMEEQWAMDVRDQCIVANVPFFFKQYGTKYPMSREARKKYGRTLDGKKWNQVPEIGIKA